VTLLAELASWSMLAFFSVLFLFQAVARELGYAFGKFRAAKRDEANDESVKLVVATILGLLGFVLAFNLSLSMTRYVDRRAGALEEANAIGTSWLQAKALDNPHAVQIAALLEEYARQRLAFVVAENLSPDIEKTTARTAELQTEIWGHLSAIVRERPDPTSNSLMNSLNNTFDASTAMRHLIDYKVPPQLVWLLLGLCIVGMGMLGYQFGLQGKHHRILTIGMGLVWTVIIVEVLDIGTARIGFVRAGTEVYEWTIQGFSEIPIPN
jgi:hypothetical protein